MNIDNIIYGCTWDGVLMWSESKSDTKTEVREWREIQGLGELREKGLRTGSDFYMEYYNGGKLLVLWKLSGKEQENKIQYARISLESRSSGREIWGQVECLDEHTFPVQSYKSFRCVTVSV
ncbi:unnamed protein product [Microthlaspi erraticum]|uniref:F-box associated domain-containing protein n=1 Tax=Microthlaspi erraticum TaxID=1685480 RepID=A0A6D2KVC3_9BRAS|nr:unnamed protein product [Microthlaspi erraticum]CAA7057824.1 unnamed protein product [Microthlaspi erraticum]